MFIITARTRNNLVLLKTCWILFMFLQFSPVASAMYFSEPELIGELWWKGNNFTAKSALISSQESRHYDFAGKFGLCRIYLQPPGPVARLGSNTNIDNTVSFFITSYTAVYETVGDNKKSIFLVLKNCFCHSGPNITIIGQNNDGQYVKFADYADFYKAYEDEVPTFGVMGKQFTITAHGDTLVIRCAGEKSKWRYLLKWNNKEHRFGILFERMGVTPAR